MTVHIIHKLRDERSHFAKEELIAAGEGLFKLNGRGEHAGYSKVAMKVYGIFGEDSTGRFYFKYDSPDGPQLLTFDHTRGMPWVHSVETEVNNEQN